MVKIRRIDLTKTRYNLSRLSCEFGAMRCWFWEAKNGYRDRPWYAWVAKDGDEVIAWATAYRETRPYRIVGVYVKKQHRRRGIASRLVKRVKAAHPRHLLSAPRDKGGYSLYKRLRIRDASGVIPGYQNHSS